MGFKGTLKRIIKLIIYGISPRKQKWFHHFEFDIMRPLPTSASKELKNILSFLQKEIPNFRISDGSLLGIYRDGKLISHDNDLDFDVEFSSRNIYKIENFAKKKNWVLGRSVKYLGETQQLSYFDQDEIIYDFIFWRCDGRFAINFSEPYNFRIMPEHYLKNLKKEFIPSLGIEVSLPIETEEWAIYRYGKNWSVPEIKKTDWTVTCGDLGKAWWIRIQ